MSEREASPLQPEISQRRAADPAVSAWVDASAGSGKTKVLIERILRLLLAEAAPDTILAVTFTKAAAAEMRNRLNAILAAWATMPDAKLDAELDRLYRDDDRGRDPRARARRLFATIVDAPVGVRIETIHSFCQSILRRFPLEAGIPPHFEVLDERSADELKEESVAAVFALAKDEPRLGASIAGLSVTYAETRLAKVIHEIIAGRAKLERAFKHYGGAEKIVALLERERGIEPGASIETLIRTACHDLEIEKGRLRAAAKLMREKGGKIAVEAAREIEAWLDCAVDARCSGLKTYMDIYLIKDGTSRDKLLNKVLRQSHSDVVDTIEKETARLQALAARCKALAIVRNTENLLILAEAILEDYKKRKRRAALLDFDDQILLTRDLLANEAAAWVLYKLDSGIDHVLVDESQDTNPVQWDLIKSLSREFFAGEGARRKKPTIFAVGDQKQSIFSFQGADPAIFHDVRAEFESAVRNAGLRWESVALDISFRSTRPILALVDAVFARPPALTGVAGQAPSHRLFRRGDGGLVEIWPLAEKVRKPREDFWTVDVASVPTEDPVTRTANRIADTIAGWKKNGEILDSENRPIRAGDILVLVRKRLPLVPKLIKELKQRGVPVAGADRMVLTEELAVMDLMVFAQFLLLPDDDMALAILLRSPLVGFSEEELFEVAHGRGDKNLYQALQEAEFAAAVACRDWLAAWLRRVDYSRPYELFAAVLNQPCPADMSGRRAFVSRLGTQALDPLDEFLNASLEFETAHAPSLQRFLHWVETKDVMIKREKHLHNGESPTNGEGEVAIMTVHGAKGLQAPIVFLAHTADGKKSGSEGPFILWQENGLPLAAARKNARDETSAAIHAVQKRRDEEEHRRLLYVGLTRAQDRLYVASWQGKDNPADNSWHRLIEPALAEPFAEPLEEGGWRVVEPHTNAPKEAKPILVAVESAAIPEYMRTAPPQEASPPRPLAPSHFIEAEPATASPLASEGRTSRFERGRLIHRLLQTLPQLSAPLREDAARRYLAGASSLSEGEAGEMIAEITKVMDDARFAAVFGPDSQAEVPVVGLIEKDGQSFALSGQIDRLVVTKDEVLIVDYKTNRPPPESDKVPKPYLKQLAAYRDALERLYPGKRIRTAILWTYGPDLVEVDASS